MSVRAYSLKDNSPLLLDEAEAASRYGVDIGFAPDQEIPVRGEDGNIYRFRGDQLPDVLRLPGYQLDFATGNAQRARELQAALPAREFGALAPLMAGGAAAADTAALGLPGTVLRHDERNRQDTASTAPNPGMVQHFVDQGYTYDDALLLADESRIRPTYTESLAETNPVATGAGTVAGVLLPAGATAGASLAAEAPIAGAALGALGRVGVRGAGARIASRALAGGAVSAAETAAQIGVQRVGEGIIENRMPTVTGEDVMLLAGAGVLGLGFNALGAAGGEAIGALRGARRAAVERVEQGALATQMPAIERLTSDIGAAFDPGTTVTPGETALLRLNQAVGNVDPSRNRRLMNPRFADLAFTPDADFNASAARVADGLSELDSSIFAAEGAHAARTRAQFAEVAGRHIASLDDAAVINTAARLRDYGERFALGTAFESMGSLPGRSGAIVNAIRRTGRALADAIPEEAETIGARLQSGDVLTGPRAAELAGSATKMRVSLQQAVEMIPNLQADLAKVSRGIASGEEADLANAATMALQSLDNFAADASNFGAEAAGTLTDVKTFRNLQAARNQMLRSFGITEIADGTDRSVKAINAARLATMASASTDNASIAQRKTIANYLTAALAADEAVQSSGQGSFREAVGAIESDLFENVLKPGAARREFQILQDQGNKGGWMRGVASGALGAVVGSTVGPVGTAAGLGIGLAAALAMRPDKRVAAMYSLRRGMAYVAGRKEEAIGSVVRRFSMPNVSFAVPARTVRSLIIPNPELYDEKTRDAEFDKIVATVTELTDNPHSVITKAEEAGMDPASQPGSEAVTNMTIGMQYLRQQMPDSLFDPLNPNPPSLRVSGMVRHKILRTLEAIHDPISVYDDFGKGFVSTEKVQAVRAVFPQLSRDMNSQVLQAYADRLSVSARMPYATRMQTSMLLGTPLEQALRQPNLAMFQQRYAQTPAQAEAQGMGRAPARAVDSLTNSTTTEGSALQDSQ